MNQYNGEIYSFDNVPGNIFCGRKHGIFNTNTSNSVRAAITVVRKDNSNGLNLVKAKMNVIIVNTVIAMYLFSVIFFTL